MNEKELKRLGRQELVDAILKLEKEKAELIALNDTLSAYNIQLTNELEKQKTMVCGDDNTGSLAEAVAEITGIIGKAQETADLYVSEVKKMRDNAERETQELRDIAARETKQLREDVERETKQMLDEADATAKDILARANIDSDCIKANAKAEADVQWQQFNARVNDILQAHAELSALLGNK